MALIKGKVQKDTSVSREAEGTDKIFRASADGALVSMDWRTAMIEEGRGFAFSIGTLVTPATGGGVGTIPDLNQPDAMVSVPSGTSIYVKRVHVSCYPGAITADLDEYEILVGIDKTNALSSGTPGTYSANTALNLNTRHARTSSCTCGSRWTVNTATATLDLELAHVIRVIDIDTVGIGTGWHYNTLGLELVYEPLAMPKIVGPGKLLVYWGGTKPVLGYATVEYFELPS